MRRLSAIFISLLLVCFCSLGRSNSYDFPLSAKVRRSVLIAEVRVDTTELRMRDPVLGDYELVCGCTILRGFKMPTPTNSVTLTIRYTQTRLYRGKTFLVFAVEDEVGYRRNRDQKPQLGYCPLRRGLIEKDQPSKWLLEPSAQDQPSTYQELGYSELIARVKAILTASPSLPAAGTDYYQHFRSLVDTNLVPLKTFPILVDTNNTGIKITNAVLNLESLKHGEISLSDISLERTASRAEPWRQRAQASTSPK